MQRLVALRGVSQKISLQAVQRQSAASRTMQMLAQAQRGFHTGRYLQAGVLGNAGLNRAFSTVQTANSSKQQNGQQENTGRNFMPYSLGMAGLVYLMHQNTTIASAEDAAEEPVTMKRVEIDFAGELKDGEMKELTVGAGKQDKVLITRYEGRLTAIGAFCCHFGVPLKWGVMFDDRVVCALHGASFHVQTGDQLTFPGDDGVPKYEVVTEGSKSYVVVPEGGLKAQKRESKMVKRDPNDSRNFVIIGGGAAGLKCAENLRKSGYTGKITMISPETILPYDRTLLSKALPVGDSNKFTLRCKGFMKRADIDIIEDRVYSIHTDVKKVTFARKGDPMDYDKILIATGGEPRKPDVKGVKAKNVFVLRSNVDQTKIKEAAIVAKKGVAVIGTGFIGSECAASLKAHYKEKLNVHMVGSKNPLEKVLGPEIATMMGAAHSAAGVSTHIGAGLKEILEDEDHNVTGVVLSDGTTLDVDMVILGAGITPATHFLTREETGVKLDAQGAVITDVFLQTDNKDIFAAGDVASFPLWMTGQQTRIEHWVHALEQGEQVAHCMLGDFQAYKQVPFFWTRHYNVSIQYVGHCDGYDEVHVVGDTTKPEYVDNKFSAFFIKDGRIQAAAFQGQAHNALTMIEAFRRNAVPSVADIKSGAVTMDMLRAQMAKP